MPARKARDPYAVVVGGTVRLLRVAQRLELDAFARSMGMANSSGWSRVETGDTTMTVVQLRRAANLLKISPSAILAQAESAWQALPTDAKD